MSNLDKLRAKNKAAQEIKAQNQTNKSENLVDDIIQSGISYEEAANDESPKEDVEKKEQIEELVPENNEPNKAINEDERENVQLNEENAVETPLNASEGKMVKKQSKESAKVKKATKNSEEQQTIKAAISLVASKKENKSVRKSFLIKESSNEKLRILAEQLGTSENDVINQILESVLSDVE